MQIQRLVELSKPGKNLPPSPVANTQDSGFYVHPHLAPRSDLHKGRFFRASASIPKGTVVLVDAPYAIVPTRAKLSQDNSMICSNIVCSQRVNLDGNHVKCSKNCDEDVIWCSYTCRDADCMRHDYECLWLKQLGAMARQKESYYDFTTLWHVVRLLAGWSLEIRNGLSDISPEYPWEERFKRHWESVVLCCDYLDSWPDGQIKHWKRLTETYMLDKSLLPCPLDSEEMLSILCKEETNTFGLYPTSNGVLDMAIRSQPRGEAYGLSLYPRAAMFNHSCQPNVSHAPDAHGRMIFTTSREILNGEECLITYLDLAVHKDLESRQELVRDWFQFRCACKRCIEEEAQENLAGIDTLPFSDF